MSIVSLNNTSRLLKIGLVANLLEWYEYSMYGYLASTMGQLFWAGTDPVILLTKAWIVFAISYLARPLGSLFWGYVGDRYGHAYSLKMSLLMMSIPTVLIGLLPTYHQVGFVATASLIVLRFMQGFAAGGELPVSACYIFEKSSENNRSVLCSSVSVGVGLGLLLGSLTSHLLYRFYSIEEILRGAWRIPYLLSVPLTFWILWIRQSIESSDHLAAQRTDHHSEHFIETSFRTLKKLLEAGFLRLVLVVGFMEVSCYVLLVWLPSYLTTFLGFKPHIAQISNVFLLATLQCWILMMGYLSSRVGYKRLLLVHILLIIGFSYPLFQGLQNASFYWLIGIHGVFAWLYSGVAAVMMEALGDAYPDEIRCSGMSVTHTVGATFFGGTAPAICTWLVSTTGCLVFPAYYMIGMGLVALPVVLRLKTQERYH